MILNNEKEVIGFVENLSQEVDFARGTVLANGAIYQYLIEGWEICCIEDEIQGEEDQEDDEYLYSLTEYKHDQLIQLEFVTESSDFEIIQNDLIEGCQFGKSVIIIKRLSASLMP